MLKNLQSSFLNSYKPKIATYGLYKNQSFYFEFKDLNETLVVSFNSIDYRIYMYYRSKNDITHIVTKSLFDINLEKLKHTYIVNFDRNAEIKLISNVLLAIVSRLEDLFIQLNNENLNKIKKFTQEKILLTGNYIDEHDNNIRAPIGLKNCTIQFLGKGNHVYIHPESDIQNIHIQFLSNNASVVIGKNVSLFGTLRLGYDCNIKIGEHTSSTSSVYMTCAEGTSINIGSDCMFATNNQIRTDDAHAIYDINTNQRINISKDIVIGNHVWIAYGALILGGAKVGDNSIIGALSLVNKEFNNNVTIAGIPAKIIHKNVTWKRPNLLYAKKTN